MESYSVLLKSESNVPAPALAAELAKILERPVGELTRALRENPWILIESVDAGDLDAVFEALGREGVIAKAVPDVHMPHLPPALRVRDADPMKKGLFLKMAEPPSPPLLPWEEVRLVAVGEVTLAPGEEDRIYGAWRGGAPSSTLSRAADTTIGSAALKTTPQKSKSPLLLVIVAEGEEKLEKVLTDVLGLDRGSFQTEVELRAENPGSKATPDVLFKTPIEYLGRY
jgi:hypothetical protein